MLLITVAVACMAFGLYAGKRRANGCGWYSIACELAKGAWDLAARAWNFVSRPFRKDGGGPDAGDLATA